MFGRRLTNPERWQTPRFRLLQPLEKLVYLYILDVCDWAGFLEIDRERIAFETLIPIDKIDQTLDSLSEEEIVIVNGWLFVIDFIYLQGNSKLNPNNNAHKNILAKLENNSIHFKGNVTVEKNLAPYMALLGSSGKGNTTGTSKGQAIGTSKGMNVMIHNPDSVWNMDFKCYICHAEKGQECQFNGTCHFPEKLTMQTVNNHEYEQS